jgi:hypothetical protein
LDLKQAIDLPTTKGIRMNSKTWIRLIRQVLGQHQVVYGGSPTGSNTFSGKPVELDDSIPEETFEIMSN